MAVLTRDRDTPQREGRLTSYRVAANVRIFSGALVVVSNGLAEPGRAAGGLRTVGRANTHADNRGGAAGDIQVVVESGCFFWANDGTITEADVGAQCFVVDDQTVAKGDGGGTRSTAGVIRGVEPGGVWVNTM